MCPYPARSSSSRVVLVPRRLALVPIVSSWSSPSSVPRKRCTRVISLCSTSPKPQLVPGCTPSSRLCVGRQSPIHICFCLLAPAAYDLINVVDVVAAASVAVAVVVVVSWWWLMNVNELEGDCNAYFDTRAMSRDVCRTCQRSGLVFKDTTTRLEIVIISLF
jgi:hypothetical protein